MSIAHENRLAAEASPYLLSHAHNPVDWHPWGDEALSLAKRENKPILLSIGYSACHFCHVMERESFEDEAIAERMNAGFVCIKVDREERPDLDQIYQLVVQLMGRSGGWPLTVFLSPDQRPFFAGTYFPPEPRHGLPGFPQILAAVSEAYRDKQGDIALQAQAITQAVTRVQTLDRGGDYAMGSDLLERACKKLIDRFDQENGGFGGRPKFPSAMSLDVLLRRGALEGESVALACVKRALDRMRAGGIWDHLRGGFHRYSTDERWLVPHFEKMLYDSALLLRLYVDGFRVFGDEAYAETARAIVGYLFAEMQDASGAFFASQDADSEGEEGAFFLWTPAQIRAALEGDELACDVALAHFGVTEEGHFEERKKSVLSTQRGIDQVAVRLGKAPSEALAALARARTALLAARNARPRPARDEKVLSSWNALLISALADAGRALGEPSWVEAATRAFDALDALLIEDGRVRRYMIEGAIPASSPACGFLDDQAYVGNAALDLFMATHDARWLRAATSIADQMLAHFWDKASGGFFFTADDAETLITRSKDVFDQASPSGASMAARLCLRLSEIADPKKLDAAKRALEAVAPAAAEDAFALGSAVSVLDRLVRGSVDVVIVGDRNAAATEALSDAAFAAYLPNGNVVVVDPSDAESAALIAPLAEGKTGRSGASVAYVCRGRTCSAMIESVAELSKALATPS